MIMLLISTVFSFDTLRRYEDKKSLDAFEYSTINLLYEKFTYAQDLKDIWLYSFERWGEKQADQYYDAIIKGIDLIAHYPKIGVKCDEIKKDFRYFKIKEYEVYYKITDTKLVIIRVLHESMSPTLHF